MVFAVLALLWVVITLALMIVVVVLGSYFLYKVVIPEQEARHYASVVENDQGEELGYSLNLTAPNGFVEGEGVKITGFKTTGIDTERSIPLLAIMRGTAGTKFIDIPTAHREAALIELSEAMRIGVAFKDVNDDKPPESLFKYEEIDVTRSRKPDLILGFIALLALSFTIPSGMAALWGLLLEAAGITTGVTAGIAFLWEFCLKS